MLFIRSLLFNICLVFCATLLCTLPILFLYRRKIVYVISQYYSHAILFCLRTVVNIHVEVRGKENQKVPALYAFKHQSAFETMALQHLLPDPAYILKKQLLSVPFMGWMMSSLEMIPVDRNMTSPQHLKELLRASSKASKENRPLIIFPEGTRTVPGVRSRYKKGVAILYETLKLPCVPVALNSGQFWGRRSFLKTPGTIVIEYLPAIPAGLPRQEFLQQLEDTLETHSLKLFEEAKHGRP